MRTQRYTLTRTWEVPHGWTKTETAETALQAFQDEIDDWKDQGFRVLTPPEIVDAPNTITFKCKLRGPRGHAYNEEVMPHA